MKNKKDTQAQIHRFRDAVAVYVGTGETVYLTPDQAKIIGGFLRDCAEDCERHKFSESLFSTKTLNLQG